MRLSNVITKSDGLLLQSGSDITKCDRLTIQSTSGSTKCHKLLLQSVSGITKCDSCYKVRGGNSIVFCRLLVTIDGFSENCRQGDTL